MHPKRIESIGDGQYHHISPEQKLVSSQETRHKTLCLAQHKTEFFPQSRGKVNSKTELFR